MSAENPTIDLLRQLADEFNLRDPQKLFQLAARRRVPGASLQQARAALRGDVARQLFRRPPRSTGKSFAEGPDTRFQVDLLDFAQNARAAKGNRYALLLADVFTRELAVEPLKSKSPVEVNEAMRKALDELVPEDEKNFVVTSDKGVEFQDLNRIVDIHRTKEAVNDIAVIDRAGQTVKKTLAGTIARKGGAWDEHIENVVDKYNETPHSTTYGPPKDVQSDKLQHFMLLQDNAQKFAHNAKNYNRMTSNLEAAKNYRIPVPTGRRSFNPQYTAKVHRLKQIMPGRLFVEDEDGGMALLKEVQPVAAGSAEPVGRLTDPQMGRRIKYMEFAQALATELRSKPNLEMRISDASKLPALRGLRLAFRSFARLFPEMFSTTPTRIALREPVPFGSGPDLEAMEVDEFARNNPDA